MNPADAKRIWFELEFALGTSVKREKEIDLRSGVDWAEIEYHTLKGAIAIACSLIEKMKRKDEHWETFREIRNALIHNQGNVTKNNNKKALEILTTYLESEKYKKLSENLSSFYRIDDSIVTLNSGIYFAVRSYLNWIEQVGVINSVPSPCSFTA